jgi:6-phosphofructokinase 2
VLVSGDHRYFCHPPVVKVRSKIGAGDAFVGAMTLALARGDPPDVALQWGVAAASATVSTEGTALCDRDAARACFEQCRIEAL